MTSHEFWQIAWPAFFFGVAAGRLWGGIDHARSLKRVFRKLRGASNG